ncbi:unnamed protein product [Symbiodinium sp. CCMP2592]|nr:unnamed protein product [Symbiodinium sp. CCMP2592]
MNCRVPSPPSPSCSRDREDREDLFVAGFECKVYSQQNASRFRADCCSQPHPTLESAIEHMKTRCKRGGDRTDKALQFVLNKLESVPGFSVKWAEGSARPLPGARNRVFFWGASSDTGHSHATQLLAQYEMIETSVPDAIYPIGSFLQDDNTYTELPPALEETSSSVAKFEGDYHQAFSKAYDAAVAAGKLPQSFVPLKRQDRVSSRLSASRRTPWQAAQLDIFAEYARHLERECPEPPLSVVADVSQSASRMHLWMDGRAPTLCTGTTLFDFRQEKFVNPAVHMRMHGFRQCDLTALSDSDIRTLAGNGMATTSLVRALLPILMALKYVEKC